MSKIAKHISPEERERRRAANHQRALQYHQSMLPKGAKQHLLVAGDGEELSGESGDNRIYHNLGEGARWSNVGGRNS